jgi:hypothetical protein
MGNAGNCTRGHLRVSSPTDRCGFTQFGLYIPEHCAPMAFRIAGGQPVAISSLITQNVNTCERECPQLLGADLTRR